MNTSKSDIKTILDDFTTISLEQMDGVKLMDRTDKKFVFNRSRLPEILRQAKDHYYVLEIKNLVFNRYETLYFDTADFFLYNEHQRGKASRYKVRARKYVDSNLHFFEVKFKNNKGRTIKNRIKLKNIEPVISDEANTFLKSVSPLNGEQLQAKLWSNCTRITLVSKKSKERLTLDIDLQFKNDDEIVNLSKLVIAEVKQEKSAGSEFINIMKTAHIREGSISKYCMAVVMLFKNIKKNNFIKKILTLNKINHAV